MLIPILLGITIFFPFFPFDSRLWFERITGALFDTINLIVIYLFSAWAVHYFEKDSSSPKVPLMVTLLFTFSPGCSGLATVPVSTMEVLVF